MIYGSVGAADWGDRPVALVGAGPSLTGFDFQRLLGPWRVVAVNQKVWDLPWANAVVSVDVKWIYDIAPQVIAQLQVPVFVLPPDNREKYPLVRGAINLQRRRSTGFSESPNALEMGATSGYAAFNLAYLKRPPLIVMFGFDYDAGREDHDKPEQYPWHPRGHNGRYWPRWAREFASTVPQITRAGIRVLCASPRSSITAFPRCTVDEGVAALIGWRYQQGDHHGRNAVHLPLPRK